jgi:hypothetical protein
MIKIATGFCGPGGSTVALSTLVNLFNNNGLDACLYGQNVGWDGIDCKYSTFDKLNLTKEDILIYHFIPLAERTNCKKQILSCHETEVFKIKDIPNLKYDAIHYVSQFQKDWQGVEGTVIPNPIRKFTKTEKGFYVAGIIGSIDPNKRVHESILRAQKDGFKSIKIYGNLTDPNYFYSQVLPLLSNDVTYNGVAKDMNKVYSGLSHVYHSPVLETYNLVKPECEAAGVTYVGNEGNDTKAEIWDNERILEEWKKLILT